MSKTVAVFSGRSTSEMKRAGGSGYWIVQPERIENAEFALLVRNHRESYAVKDFDHGQAFFIGKISGCKSLRRNRSEKGKTRRIIKFSEYAELPNSDQFKQAWKKLTGGQRYPISYLNTEEMLSILDLNLDNLTWLPFPSEENWDLKEEEEEDDDSDFDFDFDREGNDIAPMPLTEAMEIAKSIVAEAAGVEANQVSIQINF